MDLKYLKDENFIYSLERTNYIIECINKPKQKAIGNQNMIYVCLKLKNFTNLIGRIAEKKEIIEFNLSSYNFLIDILKIFSISTNEHKSDMMEILKVINRKLKWNLEI